MKHLPPTTTKLPVLLRKAVAFIATVALVGLVLMFSAVFFAIILIAGTVAFAFLWWKTRDLRKQMRSFRARDEMMGGKMREDEVIKGDVIEGEAIYVVDPNDEKWNETRDKK